MKNKFCNKLLLMTSTMTLFLNMSVLLFSIQSHAANGLIISQPQNVISEPGETVMFTVEAAGENVEYQWQYYDASTDRWINWTGATEATFTVGVENGWDGLKFRCIVSSEGKTTESAAAQIRFETAGPVITKQPEDVTKEPGETAMFAVETAGENVEYQWQYYDASTDRWINWTGATEATFTVGVESGWDGLKFRCVVAGINGKKTLSEVAKITFPRASGFEPSISISYNGNNIEGMNGVDANRSFILKAESSNAEAVQWQISSNGSDFSDLSGETGTELAYTNSPAPLESQTVYFRAVATSSTGNTAVSNVIEVLLLSEDELPIRPQSNSVESKVAENPESETVSETQAAGTGAPDSEAADKVEDKSVSGVENNGTGLAEDFNSENNTETQTEKETGSEPETESETQDMTADVSAEAQ